MQVTFWVSLRARPCQLTSPHLSPPPRSPCITSTIGRQPLPLSPPLCKQSTVCVCVCVCEVGGGVNRPVQRRSKTKKQGFPEKYTQGLEPLPTPSLPFHSFPHDLRVASLFFLPPFPSLLRSLSPFLSLSLSLTVPNTTNHQKGLRWPPCLRRGRGCGPQRRPWVVPPGALSLRGYH